MRNPFGLFAISSAFVVASVQSALSQASLSSAPEHPSGAQLLDNVEHWIVDHRGVGMVLGLSVVVAVGMLIYNRFIATR